MDPNCELAWSLKAPEDGRELGTMVVLKRPVGRSNGRESGALGEPTFELPWSLEGVAEPPGLLEAPNEGAMRKPPVELGELLEDG